jgi:hypothetical protein
MAWILLQCAVWATQHLATTELEPPTSAFAVLTIIMYVLWWDKPLDVDGPIRVRRRRSGDEEASEEQDRAREESKSVDRSREWNRQSGFRGWSWINISNIIMPFFAMMGTYRAKDDAFLTVGEPEWHGVQTQLIIRADTKVSHSLRMPDFTPSLFVNEPLLLVSQAI